MTDELRDDQALRLVTAFMKITDLGTRSIALALAEAAARGAAISVKELGQFVKPEIEKPKPH